MERYPSLEELKEDYQLYKWQIGDSPRPYWVVYKGMVYKFLHLNGGSNQIKIKDQYGKCRCPSSNPKKNPPLYYLNETKKELVSGNVQSPYKPRKSKFSEDEPQMDHFPKTLYFENDAHNQGTGETNTSQNEPQMDHFPKTLYFENDAHNQGTGETNTSQNEPQMDHFQKTLDFENDADDQWSDDQRLIEMLLNIKRVDPNRFDVIMEMVNKD
eukprot:TRINITY_DN4952_c0_g1_i2.p1 TRINITY_DN4952_c0_g1~~TRINITY_DN4952_c0_g1_i2.p1  ORF type:complete len:227 (+),score=38.20 TRINITY_DN4952_c0_g1_i2:43-681(+)